MKQNHRVQARDMNNIEEVSELFQFTQLQEPSYVVFNLNCTASLKVLQIISGFEAFNTPYTFLILGDDLNHSLEKFSDLNIHFGSQIKLIIKENGNYLLYDIVSSKSLKGISVQSFYYGTFSEKFGLQVNDSYKTNKNTRLRQLTSGNIASVCVLVSFNDSF